jgi:hypothetical protein
MEGKKASKGYDNKACYPGTWGLNPTEDPLKIMCGIHLRVLLLRGKKPDI